MNIIRLGDPSPTLSVLIASIATRQHFLTQLLARFLQQLDGTGVELVIGVDDGEISIGEKRNRLLDAAWGRYVCFFDDDDEPLPAYCQSLLQAIGDGSVDCVGFRVRRTVDGVFDGEATHSLRYEANANRQGEAGMLYERIPNHLNPIRVELAREVRFAHADSGEDTDFAVRIRPLLKRERFVDRVLYHYAYRTRRPNENTHAPTNWATATKRRVPPPMDAVIVSAATTPHLRSMTETTIRTLRETVPHVNVIVVESACVDWPECTVVRPTGPFNYNAYLMQGAAAGSAEWIGLFNNDLVFQSGWWLKILQAHSATGLQSLSPRCPDDRRQMPFVGAGVVRGYQIGRHVSGWAIVAARSVLERIGGLDAGPTFWFSDNAYAAQLQAHGVEHGLVTDSLVRHRASQTLRLLTPAQQNVLKSDPTGRFSTTPPALASTR